MVDVLGPPFTLGMAQIGHSAPVLRGLVVIFPSVTAAHASRKAELIICLLFKCQSRRHAIVMEIVKRLAGANRITTKVYGTM
jgi:hypothetical protein